MAFIEKKDPVVLNIKLTSKGREQLSKGKLNFTYFAIGDSEIDYGFNIESNAVNGSANLPYSSLILRPADKNPNLLSFITKNNDGNPYNLITSIPSTPTTIQNAAQPLGFFRITDASTTFIVDLDHVKQPDVMINNNAALGGKTISLFKSPTFGANRNEPEAGDILLIKWSITDYDTTGYTVNRLRPIPYLIYKIESVDGVLADDSVYITVDRELPNFELNNNGYSGAMILYNYIKYTGDTIYNNYSTDYVNESVIAFLQNCQCPNITYPFWNMSIVFTEEIAGVQDIDLKYPQFNTNVYGGFISYIQNQAPTIKKLGVIHYTNASPTNTYGEELYGDTPTLHIPTIMWHKSSKPELGVVLKAHGSVKSLTGTTRSLNTKYYDLADLNGNVVGKVFNDLKLFVIEDQELIFAMSYKSNRSWTLPNYVVGVNDSAIFGCPECAVTFDVLTIKPSVVGTNTGKFWIHDIANTIGIEPDVELILSVSGETHGHAYLAPISGNTLVTGLYADTYHIIIYDLRATTSNCVGQTVVIPAPDSLLSIYDLDTTGSGLNPNFSLVLTDTINPTLITVMREDVIPYNGIGQWYGTPEVGYSHYGAPAPTNYLPFVGSPAHVDLPQLNFKGKYTIYVRDTVTPDVFTVSKDYVAVRSPLNANFTTLRTDSGGTHVTVSNYLTTISPSLNPIVGEIQMSVYRDGQFPALWETIPSSLLINGGLPFTMPTGNGVINISIREIYDTIPIDVVSKTVDYSGVIEIIGIINNE